MPDLCIKLNNFDKKRVMCECGCGEGKIDIRLLLFLHEIEKKGIKYHISSIFRCKKHNASKAVGGAPNSKHLYGLAVDVHFDVNDDEIMFQMTDIASHFKLRHLNYSWGMHFDTGKEPGFCYDVLDDLYENRLAK